MLSRFARYIERRWEFSGRIAKLRDSRQARQISTSVIFLTVFLTHVTRLGSFNGTKQQLSVPGLWDPWVGP